MSIGDASSRWLAGPVDEVYVGGGGVRNAVLMAALCDVFASARVTSMEQAGWNSKAFEAMAFGVLAYQAWQGVCANVPNATGARHAVILGSISPGLSGAWRS